MDWVAGVDGCPEGWAGWRAAIAGAHPETLELAHPREQTAGSVGAFRGCDPPTRSRPRGRWAFQHPHDHVRSAVRLQQRARLRRDGGTGEAGREGGFADRTTARTEGGRWRLAMEQDTSTPTRGRVGSHIAVTEETTNARLGMRRKVAYPIRQSSPTITSVLSPC